MVVFKLRLEQTYWSKGFFNVPVDFERFLSLDDGAIEIFLGSASMATTGRMSRSANRNATPRVFGNKPLQVFFQSLFKVGDYVSVEFLSPKSVRIGGQVNLEGTREMPSAATVRAVAGKQVALDGRIQSHIGRASGRAVDGYLVVVSCGDEKIWKRRPDAGPTVARDAYTSSKFKKSRLYAERFAPTWVVLSAKYGFIDSDSTVPENYNVTFSDPDAIPLVALRAQVVAKGLTRFTTVGVLGSNMYWEKAEKAFEGTGVPCRHVNGNISYPPTFHTLINGLLEKDQPFREEDEA